MTTFKQLQSEILKLFELSPNSTDSDIRELLNLVTSRIDSFFSSQRRLERIIVGQSEALANMAVVAERLKMQIPETDPCFTYINKILDEQQ